MIKFNPSTNKWEVSVSVRIPGIVGPRRKVRNGIDSQAQAKRIERILKEQLSKQYRELAKTTWSAAVESYLKSLPNAGVSEKTISDYSLGLSAHTMERWKNHPIDEITTSEIRSLIQVDLKDKRAGTQKNILKFIRAVFLYSLEEGLVLRNPVPRMKFRMGDKIKGVLTEIQIEIFLNRARELNSEWYPIWVTALYTGMRNGELIALTWDKVNLEERKILVDCSWNNVDGYKSTKSGDDRIVEIAPELVSLFRELKLKGADSAYVLPRPDKWMKGEQARELQMFLIGLGLPGIRFHDLRASWATIMLGKGIEPIKVMHMGGWKDIKTLMIYMRKAGIEIRGITDKLKLHDHVRQEGVVIQMHESSNL